MTIVVPPGDSDCPNRDRGDLSIPLEARRSRVLHVIQSYPPEVGGAEIQAHRVSRLLASQFDMRVLTGSTDGCPHRSIVDGVTVRRVPLSERGGKVGAASVITSLLTHGLRSGRPDIIQAFQLNGTTIAGAMLARLFRVPLIVKIASRNNFDRTEGAVGSQKLRFLVHSTSVFVAPSHNCLREAVERGVPRDQLRYIPNGVDTEYFAPANPDERIRVRTRLGYLPDDFVFCWIGRLDPVKGLDRLLATWGGVQAQQPKARLLVVGEGSEETIARRLVDLFPSVRWAPFSTDVRPYYHAADSLIVSSHKEGLSNTLLEAIACGLPAVVSSAPENVEVGAGAGFLTVFDVSSDADIQRALIHASTQRDAHQLWAEEARWRAQCRYELRATAALWADLYQSLLARRSVA